jgi:hypothetical protein
MTHDMSIKRKYQNFESKTQKLFFPLSIINELLLLHSYRIFDKYCCEKNSFRYLKNLTAIQRCSSVYRKTLIVSQMLTIRNILGYISFCRNIYSHLFSLTQIWFFFLSMNSRFVRKVADEYWMWIEIEQKNSCLEWSLFSFPNNGQRIKFKRDRRK